MPNLTDFILSFPKGSSERDYYEALATIIAEIDYPAEQAVACGLVLFLDTYDFTGPGIDTVTHPAAGSMYADAALVAALFPSFNRDASWWKGEALRRAREETTEEKRQWWRAQFADSVHVERVF